MDESLTGEIAIDFRPLPHQTSPEMTTFGANVRRLREARNLQAKQLAEIVDVQPSVVSAWENDRKGLPETPTLLKIAKALDASVDELLEGIDADYETLRKAKFEIVRERLRSASDKITELMVPAVESGAIPKEIAIAVVDNLIAQLSTTREVAVQAMQDADVLGDDVTTGYKRNDIPVIAEGDASPAPNLFWNEQGLKSDVEDRISRPYDVSDPRAYGVKVRGDSMIPRYKPGEVLVVSPNTPVEDGDEVYVALLSGERLLKIARRAKGGWILESENRAYPARFVTRSEIGAMHPILWIRKNTRRKRIIPTIEEQQE